MNAGPEQPVPIEIEPRLERREITFAELVAVLWAGKWVLIGSSILFGSLAVIYSLFAREWYRADVVLAPADEQTLASPLNALGAFGGLAGLAGVTVGGGSDEPIAILLSRDFAREFIEENDLLPVLLSDEWDEEAGRWKETDPDSQPDVRDAIRFFDRSVRSVSESPDTSMVTLSIQWTDPTTAAAWANELVARLNETVRQRALREAEQNVAYLREELAETNVATLRQSIGTLLETELQKLMLARGNIEFAFKVIDSAQAPKIRSWPRRSLLAIMGVFLGGILGFVFVLTRHALKVSR